MYMRAMAQRLIAPAHTSVFCRPTLFRQLTEAADERCWKVALDNIRLERQLAPSKISNENMIAAELSTHVAADNPLHCHFDCWDSCQQYSVSAVHSFRTQREPLLKYGLLQPSSSHAAAAVEASRLLPLLLLLER